MPGPPGSRWARAHAGDWRYHLKRLPDGLDVIDEAVEAVFLAGQCHALAYALKCLYWRPMVGVGRSHAPNWPGHAHFGVITKDDRVLDIQGIHDPMEWAESWGGDDIHWVTERLLHDWVRWASEYKMTEHSMNVAILLMEDRRSSTDTPSLPSRPPFLHPSTEGGTIQTWTHQNSSMNC